MSRPSSVLRTQWILSQQQRSNAKPVFSPRPSPSTRSRACDFVDARYTADYQTTNGIAEIVARDGNKDDLIAFLFERMLPVDEVEASSIADELLRSTPQIGYLTISNALQWRLQYRRVIERAGVVPGVSRL